MSSSNWVKYSIIHYKWYHVWKCCDMYFDSFRKSKRINSGKQESKNEYWIYSVRYQNIKGKYANNFQIFAYYDAFQDIIQLMYIV